MKALPSVQSLWEKNKDKGLHVFLVESQGGTKEDMEKYAKERGLTFPIPVGGSDFSGYKTPGGLPYAMVIGPDGKIVWEGRKGYESVVQKQIERIKYPGLGKLEVHRDCEKAATYFAEGVFGKSREEAEKVVERSADDEEAVADAQFIIKRVDETVKEKNDAVDEAIEKKRYHDAVRILEELEGRAFKGLDDVQEAAEKRLDELEDDDEIKEEIKAWERLERTLKQHERMRDDAQRKASLIRFWEKHQGTAAAEEAQRLADALTG